MLISVDKLQSHGWNPKGVIHVGAHTGEEQKLYDEIGVEHVVWIEALTGLSNELLNKYRTRKDVQVIKALISDKEEILPFYVTNNKASSSMLKMGTHETSHPRVWTTHEEVMKTTRLKDLKIDWPLYDCLNLDIQGAELKALKGMDLTYITSIYTEVNTDYVYRDNALMWEIDEYLTDFERVETNITKYNWGDALYMRC